MTLEMLDDFNSYTSLLGLSIRTSISNQAHKIPTKCKKEEF